MLFLKTGIGKLDGLLEGGLSERTNFLVIGAPSSKKDLFISQFLSSGAKLGEPCAYVTTDNSPADLEKRALSIGMDVSRAKFVDCYSWALQQKRPEGRGADIVVPGPSSLNELSIAISRALSEIAKPGANSRVAFHSLSTLVLYNNADIVFRFIQVMGARLKGLGATTLFSIESGMHDERVITTLEHLTDASIEFKSEGGRDYFRIPRMPSGKTISDWMEFAVTPMGIEIK